MLVLASRSPRRRRLLKLIEPRFSIRPSEIPEVPFPGETPERFALRLAKEKARAVAGGRSDALILGADTVVAKGSRIFGKPADAAEARRMLRALSGAEHRVITGVAVYRSRDGRVFSGRSVTRVTFERLAPSLIEAYVATGEPMDAAGAYQIQGAACAFIPRIEGSYSNVVGLPLDLVARLLREARTGRPAPRP